MIFRGSNFDNMSKMFAVTRSRRWGDSLDAKIDLNTDLLTCFSSMQVNEGDITEVHGDQGGHQVSLADERPHKKSSLCVPSDPGSNCCVCYSWCVAP